MSRVRVHGVNASPFVRKVRVVLAEKQVAYELVPVMPIGVPDSFRRISPLGKIPCFEDGDYTLPDSSCICAYLEREHPEPPLYPHDSRDYGRALWYEEYADTRLVEVCGTPFFERVVQARILGGEADEENVRDCLAEQLPPVLDYLEGELARAGDWLVGGRFGIADVATASPFVNLRHAGEDVDPGRWPALRAWLDRTLARPSFHALVKEERAALEAL